MVTRVVRPGSIAARTLIAGALAVTLLAASSSLFAAPAHATTVREWDVTQVTQTGTSETNYQLSGDRVVWEGALATSHEILTWTLGDGIHQITSNSVSDTQPTVSGDRVAWLGQGFNGSFEVFTWTSGGDIVQVTDTPGDEAPLPQVSGDRVVWRGPSGAGWDLFTWTPDAGIQQLTFDGSTELGWRVSGDRVVWYSPAGGSDNEIFTWTPADGTLQLTNNISATDDQVDVSGDRVVWRGQSTVNYEIYTWTPGMAQGGTAITDNEVGDEQPRVSADRVVWRGQVGTTWEVFTWTPTDGTVRLTTNTSTAEAGWQVSGDNVVWRGPNATGYPDIFVWSPGPGAVQLTNNSLTEGPPQISGDRVVWGAGSVPDLYTAKLRILTADVSVAPDNVSFGDVLVGGSASSTVTVTNSGEADLILSWALDPAPAGVVLGDPGSPTVVTAGASVDILLLFAPADPGPVSGALKLTTDVPGKESITVPISGNAVSPDTLPPVTSATLDPAGWTKGPVTLTLTASDEGGSGVAATYYQLAGGEVQTYGGPVSLTAATAVSFWSVDGAGNSEPAQSVTPLIDTVAPVTSIDPAGEGPYADPVIFSLSATDEGGSGMGPGAVTTWWVDEGTPQASTTVTVTGAGAHTIHFFSIDAAGNAEQQHDVDVVLGNTGSGEDVSVTIDGVEVVFATVLTGGTTSVTKFEVKPPEAADPTFSVLGLYVDIETTAVFDGPVTIAIPYNETGLTVEQEQALLLRHWDGSAWADCTQSVDVDGNVIIGSVMTLSPFAIDVASPPVAVLSAPATVAEGETVALDASASTDPDDDIVAFIWDLDGDGFYEHPGAATESLGGLQAGSHLVGVKVTDSRGLEATATASILVTGASPPVIDSVSAPLAPVAIKYAVSVSAAFSYAGGPCTAFWDWGDGSTGAGTVTPTPGGGIVTGSHTYATPGVYSLTVSVTDAGGASDSATYQYVVVYDPSCGFVTGGGWFCSPAGALVADPTLSGKATFGFVSKYAKGATLPSGSTEFDFHDGNLNLQSRNFQWLVISGARAQYKGIGTINGTGTYGFLLTAIDGQVNGGGGVDKIRIKIWDIDNGGAIVYDNQMGTSDTGTDATAIGGGSIVIHK